MSAIPAARREVPAPAGFAQEALGTWTERSTAHLTVLSVYVAQPSSCAVAHRLRALAIQGPLIAPISLARVFITWRGHALDKRLPSQRRASGQAIDSDNAELCLSG